MMRLTRWTAAAVTLAFAAPYAAQAQVLPGSQEIGVHFGYLWGDTVSDHTFAGQRPELSNDWVLGLSWGFNPTRTQGWEARYTYANTELRRTGTGQNIDMPLHLIDINYNHHFTPDAPAVWYGTVGLGWAWANLDDPIQGVLDGAPITVDDGDGFTANIGFGVKWTMPQLGGIIRWDLRYRYMDQLIDNLDDTLDTFETTVGYSFQF